MEAPKPSPDYLMQLMNDRRVAGTAPLSGVFAHVDRLLEQEITRVRADMYGESLNGGGLGRPRVLLLPEPKGSPVQLQDASSRPSCLVFVAVTSQSSQNNDGK
ncbi:KH domain-containing RNA-binding protein QKI-like [Petromyzon marinus]|uniref:KH domain-containing RNA-binding protein QKI-like n=1 Tax=Petromyzon marinus TaxID=7757 RepID=UPI003F70549E